MKKIKLLVTFLLFSFSLIKAQHQHAIHTEAELIENKLRSIQLIFDQDSLSGFNEAAAAQQASMSAVTKWEQTMQIAYAKRKYINQKYDLNSVARSYITNPTPQSPCTNVDFETGNATGWTITEGTNTNSSTMAGCCPTASTRFSVVGPGTDPTITAISTVPAGAGNFTMLIGDGPVTGAYVVRANQTFNVTAANSVFIYRYAVILEATDGSHTCTQQPYFNISFTDCSGNPIPCGQYNVVNQGGGCSSGGDASFISTTGTNGLTYMYKNWTVSSFDLTSYIGQCVSIEFTASDCTAGGHAGWAYVDCSCQPMTLSLNGTPIPVGQANSYICQGLPNNQLCAPPGFVSYTWNGPGVTGQTTQCVSANATGSYSVTLGMAGTSCNSPVLYTNFSYTQKPTADFTYVVAPCSVAAIPFTDNSSTNGGQPISSYNWYWGDGTANGTGATPTHSFATNGTETVKLVINNGACSDSITKTFNISSQPVASFTTANVCVGNIANFVSTSTPTAGLASQVWSFGDGSANGMGGTTSHTYATPNTYTVKLVVTSSGLCKDSISQPITIYPKPTVAFTTSPVCFGTATSFNNTTSIPAPGTISNWYWDFDDNGIVDNTTQSPTYNYPATGNYTAELKASTSNGCSDSTTVLVKVNPVPTVTFTPVNACVNSSVVLNNTSSVAAPDNIALWSWSFGANSSPATSSNQNPSVIYSSSGVQTITLTATSNNSCTATTTQTVTVNPQPTAAFIVSSVCQGIATTFTDQSTPAAPSASSVTAWAWDYTHDGSTDNTTQNPSFTYGSSGTYTAALVVTSANGCKDTILVPVNVWGHATVNFSPANVCYGTASAFTDQTSTATQPNTGNLQTWSWNFGDGGTSGSQNPMYTYSTGANTNTSYTVKLVVNTSHGCMDSLSKTVTVYALPTANFTSDSVCFNTVSHLVDASNGNGNTLSGYAWDFTGDNVADVSGTSSPNYTFPGYGNNVVNYTVSTTPAAALSCTNSVTHNVWVNPLPVPAFTFANVCINAQPMNYDASGSSVPVGTNTLYAWSYGDGQNGTGITSTHTYAAASVYNVSLTVTTNKGCTQTLVQQAEIYEKPHVTLSSTRTCLGNATTFTGSSLPNSGNVAQWLWDFNNSINTIEGIGQQTSFTFGSAGTKTISLVSVTDKGCKDTITRQMYVNYLPQPQFTVDKPAGCPLLCVNFTDNTPALTGPSQIVNWTWKLGDGTVINANSNASQSHCYTNSSSSQLALFDVTLVATSDSACVDSMVKHSYITVYPVPIAAYTVNPNPGNVTEPLEYFTNESHDYTKWWWTFGDGIAMDSSNVNPTHLYSDVNAATYPTRLVVANQYGCRDTAYVQVEIGPEFIFYIPNCFTPNGDGINDAFSGKGIGIDKYEMWIFDRWGNMIFYTEDINKQWDGKVQGKPNLVQQDVYVWKVKLFDVFGKKHDYIGHVTVLRGGGAWNGGN